MAIMNYMQKDPDTFIQVEMQSGETPFAAVVSLIQKAISDSHESEDFLLHKTGTDLIIGLLENLHGRIDTSISNIMELLVTEIQKVEDRCVKLLIIQAISMCFAYNPALTFQIIEEKQWTQGVFQILFDALPSAKYDFEIQRLTLGLIAIISCRDYQLPDIVTQAMPQIFKELLLLCQKSIYTREQKNKPKDQKQEELCEKAYNILDDWSDDDDYEDEEYDPDESKNDSEELYKSYTQEIDEVLEVKKTLENLDMQIFNLYFSKVTREDQAALQECLSSPLLTN